MRYSIEPRDNIHVKDCGFFYLLLKSVHKNTCKILESEYENHAKKSVTL